MVLGLYFFLLHLVYVVGFELVFHHRVDKLCVDPLGVLFLLFQRAFSAFLVGGSAVGQTEQVVS